MLLAHRQQHAMPNDADDVKGKWLSSVETGEHGVRLGSQLDRAQAQSMIESWAHQAMDILELLRCELHPDAETERNIDSHSVLLPRPAPRPLLPPAASATRLPHWQHAPPAGRSQPRRAARARAGRGCRRLGTAEGGATKSPGSQACCTAQWPACRVIGW